MTVMCSKVLTTVNAVMLLFQESTTEQQKTKIGKLSVLHLWILNGPHPLCPLCILELCQQRGSLTIRNLT